MSLRFIRRANEGFQAASSPVGDFCGGYVGLCCCCLIRLSQYARQQPRVLAGQLDGRGQPLWCGGPARFPERRQHQ